MQAVLTIDDLPQGAVEAASEFYRDYLPRAEALISKGAGALAIAMSAAPRDHDDWRRALARDLARLHAPKRVNVIGADEDSVRATLLAYLRDAPGITGQYLPGHE